MSVNNMLNGFQSTPLMRGETLFVSFLLNYLIDFNPLPSCKGRHKMRLFTPETWQFQSTPLMRGETVLRV